VLKESHGYTEEIITYINSERTQKDVYVPSVRIEKCGLILNRGLHNCQLITAWQLEIMNILNTSKLDDSVKRNIKVKEGGAGTPPEYGFSVQTGKLPAQYR
jgi:hypothetical protein